jgi:hypothetical protein
MIERDDFTEALALAKRDEVTPEQVARLALALAPVYGAAVATAAATASASSSAASGAATLSTGSVAAGGAATSAASLLGQTVLVKAIVAMLTAAALGAASFAALRVEREPAAKHAAPDAAPVAPARVVPPARVAPPSALEPGLEPPAAQAPSSHAQRASGALPQAHAKRPSARKDTPVEAQLLTQAHAALRDDAARALRLANEHRARFPHGALAHERELLAIGALERLGRTREAAARKARALRELPHSVALERSGPLDPPADGTRAP